MNLAKYAQIEQNEYIQNVSSDEISRKKFFIELF